jgi:hypothetical protein
MRNIVVGFFNTFFNKFSKLLAIAEKKQYALYLRGVVYKVKRGGNMEERMKGYYIQSDGEIVLLGEISLSEELLKEAGNAFEGDQNGALKNQLEAIFMSNYLETLPDSWGPKCGAIVHRNVWVGGPRSSELWLKALPKISPVGDADKDSSRFPFSRFPDFWFCCTKEDTPDGFNNLLIKKSFFSDLVKQEEFFLRFFKSVYWTRLCPLETPPNMLHLAKTILYSLKTVKAAR